MQPRAALACAVLAAISVAAPARARADKRPVAVINLDPSAAGDEAVRHVEKALEDHPRLRGLREPNDEIALHDAIPAADDALAAAGKALAEAHDKREAYQLDDTVRAALGGLDLLERTSPVAARRPYADLLFELGAAKLGQRAAREASAVFLLVHRLAPEKKLDDDVLPDIAAAFARATDSGKTAPLAVRGTGRVWIDGVDVGAAPGAFQVGLGEHLVQLTGPDREPRGARPDVAAGGTQVDLPDAPISRAVQIYRARAEIAAAADSLARASAIERFAALVGVKDVVMFGVIVEGDKVRLTEQTWQEQFGFSAIHAPEEASLVLDDLAPPLVEPPPQQGSGSDTVQVPDNRITKRVDPLPETPLYAQRWFQGTLGGVIVSAIITGIVLGTREGSIGVSPKISGNNHNWP